MKIFLSYARADRERANAVKMLLELGGATVFMDWRSIAPGTVWRDELARALAECDTLCVFWSAATLRSEWVRREYETFVASYPDRPCVPLRADETPLPPVLEARQAPPEMLALCGAFDLQRELVRAGAPKADVAQRVRERLDRNGIHVDDVKWKKLAVAFSGGVLVAFGGRAFLAKLVAVLVAIASIGTLVWVRCQGAAPFDPRSSADARSPSDSPLTDGRGVDGPIDGPDEQRIDGPTSDARPTLGLSICGFVYQALQVAPGQFQQVHRGEGHTGEACASDDAVLPDCVKDPSIPSWGSQINLVDFHCVIFNGFERCARTYDDRRQALDDLSALVGVLDQCLPERGEWTAIRASPTTAAFERPEDAHILSIGFFVEQIAGSSYLEVTVSARPLPDGAPPP